MNLYELEKLFKTQKRNFYDSLPCMVCGSEYTYVRAGDGLERCDDCGFVDEMDHDHPLLVEKRLQGALQIDWAKWHGFED